MSDIPTKISPISYKRKEERNRPKGRIAEGHRKIFEKNFWKTNQWLVRYNKNHI